MAKVTIEMIKELREITGSGMMDVKKALTEAEGDMEKAEAWLREKGISIANKKSSRVTAEGRVESYIHAGGRIGVLVEVNIETDFAAKNEEFIQFTKDLAMQIAAMNPRWISRNDVPADELEKEKTIVRNQALNEGKKEAFIDKIVEGRLGKFYEANCLLEQSFIKDDDKTIQEVLTEKISKIGENITIRRFTRYEMGEGIERKEEDFAAEVAKQLG